ncbi:MAG: rhomboid family intramembrane serine protease [Armatimonadota bacterium]
MSATSAAIRPSGEPTGAPLRRGRAESAPIATYLLIAAQIAAWFVVRRFLLTGGAWTSFALIPGAPSELGLIVSPFVHLDPTHLGLNLAVLWLFGTNLERALGSLHFLFLYLGAAWFASLMQWAVGTSFHLTQDLAVHPAAVGASGAIAGILGASLVRFPLVRLRFPLVSGATFSSAPILVLWFVYTLIRALVTTVSGSSSGVGHWAHLSGFIFGLGMAQIAGLHHVAREEFLERAAEEATQRRDSRAAALAWAALLTYRPRDLAARRALIAARLELDDDPGARRLARQGLELLVRAGDREAACAALAEYTALLPDLDLPPGLRYRIGCWLAEAGDLDESYRVLWDSVRDEGQAAAAPAALHRAALIAWERLHSPERARAAWLRLVEQYPQSPWTHAARERLALLGDSPPSREQAD